VLIYDQTCAAEKRRRRKKGKASTPPRRMFINEAVCEGCGDCGTQSNCTSILPVETPLGRKRRIDQSSCNLDFSCAKGFCPSFVSVHGGKPRSARVAKSDKGGDVQAWPALPTPAVPQVDEAPWNVLITGIGGSGVITIGALMGMASHLEGKGVSVLDMTGMSQKNGAVTSHVRIAATPARIHAQRIATGEAHLILGCDMLTSGAQDAISKTRVGVTHALINTHEQPTGHFAQQPDWQFPAGGVRALITEAVGEGHAHFLDATRVATALMGDSIATNLFLLGHAWQQGLIPLEEASLLRAIELNGVAIEANKQAFTWGRRMAADAAAVERVVTPPQPVVVQMPQSVDALVRLQVERLTAYQDAAYAERYRAFVERVRTAEGAVRKGDAITRAVAQNLAKLMAIKDEYEVARLYTDGAFAKRLAAEFEGDVKLRFHMAPPLLAKFDAQGRPVKREFGGWMLSALGVLAKLRFLRGGALDFFGRTAERRMERQLLADWRTAIERAVAQLDDTRYDTVLELARLPESIRGFGHVKEAAVVKARTRWVELEARLARPAGSPADAAADVAATRHAA
jgi:indolepyruvate ferredoxin oxidoreductase